MDNNLLQNFEELDISANTNAPDGIRLFRPEQMRNIPQLGPEEKVRYENGLRQLWTVLSDATQGSPQQTEAHKKIMDFSRQLVIKMKQRMPEGQVDHDTNAQTQLRVQPQRPPTIDIHIQQHLDAMSWIPPPQVVEQGPEAAAKWSATNKEKYQRAMLQMRSTTERLKNNENLAKVLQQKGATITPEEEKSLQNIQSQKPQVIRAFQDAKRFVEEFRKGQVERMTASSARDK